MTPIHNISTFASQLCKYILSLTLVSQCLAIVDQILGNCATLESFHVQILDHRVELTSTALPFPLFLSLFPAEVRVDRRHGWVVSALSFGDSGVLRGLVRLGSSSKGEVGKQQWQRERGGTAHCCSTLFVFSHVSAKEGDAGCGWLGLCCQEVCVCMCVYIHKQLEPCGTPQGRHI